MRVVFLQSYAESTSFQDGGETNIRAGYELKFNSVSTMVYIPERYPHCEPIAAIAHCKTCPTSVFSPGIPAQGRGQQLALHAIPNLGVANGFV